VVHVVVTWNSDYEEAYVEEGSPGDADDSPNVYEADVPAELWATFTEAQHALEAAYRSVLAVAGLDKETGRLTAPCPAWQGDVDPGRSWWSVVLAATDDGERWPVRDAGIALKDTQRDAVSFLEALPVDFYLVPDGGRGLVQVHRDQLQVERAGWGPWVSACHRCGWPRGEHAQDFSIREESP